MILTELHDSDLMNLTVHFPLLFFSLFPQFSIPILTLSSSIGTNVLCIAWSAFFVTALRKGPGVFLFSFTLSFSCVNFLCVSSFTLYSQLLIDIPYA